MLGAVAVCASWHWPTCLSETRAQAITPFPPASPSHSRKPCRTECWSRTVLIWLVSETCILNPLKEIKTCCYLQQWPWDSKYKWKQTNCAPPANPHYDDTAISKTKLQILVFQLSEIKRPNRQCLSLYLWIFIGQIAPHCGPLSTICSFYKWKITAGIEAGMGLVSWVMIRKDINNNREGRTFTFTLSLWVQH